MTKNKNQFVGLFGIIAFATLICTSGAIYANTNCLNNSDISCQQGTTISVQLYNSYSGNIDFNSGTSNWVISGGNIRIGNPLSIIDITANDTSTYTLQGGSGLLTGFGNSLYTHTYTYNLGYEGLHELQTEYNRSGEFLYSNILSLYTDYTSPSIPINNGYPNDYVFTNTTGHLSRTQSIDTGVGLAGYFLYISLNPNFPSTVPLRISGSSIRNFNTNDLPRGTLFYKIVAIDYVGHEATSNVYYFHNQTQTLVGNGGGVYNNPVPIQDNQITTNTTEDTSYLHPVATIGGKKTKIFNQDNKALKLYIIKNFIDHPVEHRVLPDVMPQTGVDGYELTKLEKQDIEALLHQEQKTKSCFLIILIALLSIAIGLFLYHKKRYKKSNKLVDK